MACDWKRSPPTSPVTVTRPLELLRVNVYDIAVLDRDIPGPSGDEIAERSSPPAVACRSSCSPRPTGSTTRRPGSDSAPTTTSRSRSNSGELVLRLRALDRRRATTDRPSARSQACVWIRSAARSTATGRYIALTRKQFAVLEVLVAAEGGVVSAEELLDAGMGRERRPVHQRRAHNGLGTAQTPRRTLDHRHHGRRRLPHRHSARQRALGRGPWIEPLE